MKIIISDEELKDRMRLPLPSFDDEGSLSLPESFPEIVEPPELGRPKDSEAIDPLTKELIARDAAFIPFTNLSQRDIAKIHNVTQPTVSHMSRGFTTTNIDTRKFDEDLSTTIKRTKNNIIDSATTRLMEVLDIFNPEALKQSQMPEAAVKMASVIERIEGRNALNFQPAVQFHIYSPRTRHEDSYEVIDVSE